MSAGMSNRMLNATESDFEDISSFSSIDSYQPEPFRGNIKEKPTGIHNEDITPLAKNDTVKDSEHDITVSEHAYATDNQHEDEDGNLQHDLTSRASSATLRKHDSRTIEKIMTQNAKNDNVETVESLAAHGLDGSRRSVPDINVPLSMTQSEFPEEYNLETTTGLVKMKTIETLRKQNSRVSSTQGSTRSKTESQKSTKSNKSSTDESKGLTAAKLNQAVEKNRRELEKYNKHKNQKGIKGFFSKIFD